jgi:hypothetical protein
LGRRYVLDAASARIEDYIDDPPGPGQSTEDVKWLDEKLRELFGDNSTAGLKSESVDSTDGGNKSVGVPG